MAQTLNYIDLFSGCGGLSFGLMRSGWKGLFAVEKDANAFSTLKFNLIDGKKHFLWPDWLKVQRHDIDKVLKKHTAELQALVGKVDLVAGGPPCQGFSVVGRRNENDKRNKLVDSYVSFIALTKPKLVFFENVRGFTMEFAKKGSGTIYSDYVTEQLQALGYDVHSDIVNFADYGVPQRRLRFILVGRLKGKAEVFFQKLQAQKSQFLQAKNLPHTSTISQAVSDLERRHGEMTCPDSKRFNSGIYAAASSRYQKAMRAEHAKAYPDSHRFPKHREEIKNRFLFILKNAPRDQQLSAELKAKYKLKKRSITPLAGDVVCPTITSLPDDYNSTPHPGPLPERGGEGGGICWIQRFFAGFETT
jgi:DNA (cytosine-5)-methyltransferase 1